MLLRRRLERRRGGTIVETAIVLIPLIMIMMGILEYGWLLLNWNLLNNAAREGCRYALVNNTATTISADVTSVVTTRMGGRQVSFNNFTVTVSGTQNGAATAVNNLSPGDWITVTVSGDYKFLNVIPFVPRPSLTMTSAVTMLCEGGT